MLRSIVFHVKGRETLSHRKHCSVLPETPGLESGLYLQNLCASLCNGCSMNIHFYIFIMKYILQSVSRHTDATAVVVLFYILDSSCLFLTKAVRSLLERAGGECICFGSEWQRM